MEPEHVADELPPPPRAGAGARSEDRAAIAERPAAWPELPGYEILAELGRGGMGVVYKARQLGFDRVVALKMILAGAHAGLEEQARFQREIEAVARLGHPHIVQVYEVGRRAGQPYFSMEYLEGGSLAEKLTGTPLTVRQGADLIRSLARAIHYAHQRGIVHRDLKPANVLLTADGTPKVTDFGLAKRLDQDSRQTHSGAVLGTPSYMAPEQAAGKVQEVGPLADVYALGAILYELLTGRPPFQAATPGQTVQQVLTEEPVRPTRLHGRLPRDLETICLKCLQKEPPRRYLSAGDLADDLGRFLERRPIAARPVGPLERTGRWCRRNPAVAALLIAVFASLAAGVVLTAHFAIRATTRAHEADANARRADEEAERVRAQKRTADRFLYAAHLNLAQRAFEEGQTPRLRDLLNGQRPERTSGVDLRGFEWYYFWRACHRGHRSCLRGHQGAVLAVAYSPYGKILATAGADGTVRLWDATTGRQQRLLNPHAGPLRCLAFSPDGTTLATGSDDHVVRLWDLAGGRECGRFCEHATGISAVVFAPDGQAVASGGDSGDVRIWDRSSGRLKAALSTAANGGPVSLAYSPDGKLLAYGGRDRNVRVCRVADWKEMARTDDHDAYITALAFSPDGRTLASGGEDGLVKLRDPDSLNVRKALRVHHGQVTSLAFSPDSQALASCGTVASVQVCRLDTGEVRLMAHSGEVTCVAFSPTGRTLASASNDGTTRVWDAADAPDPTLYMPGEVYSVAFSPDGRTLASGRLMGVVELSDAVTGRRRRSLGMPWLDGCTVGWLASGMGEGVLRASSALLAARSTDLRGHTNTVRAVAFAPDGRLLASGGSDRAIRLWDVNTGQEVARLEGHGSAVWSLAFSPDGKTLASAGYTDHTVRLWDVAGRKPQAVLRGHPERIWCVAFSPDGRTLASGDSDGTAILWDAQTATQRLRLPRQDGAVWAVAFSHDGRILAAGLGSGDITLWDTATGLQQAHYPGRQVTVRSLAFLPDGQTLASAGDDRNIKLWDLPTGQERATLHGHQQWVWCIACSPDGKTLASASVGVVRLWRAATADEVAAYDGR